MTRGLISVFIVHLNCARDLRSVPWQGATTCGRFYASYGMGWWSASADALLPADLSGRHGWTCPLFWKRRDIILPVAIEETGGEGGGNTNCPPSGEPLDPFAQRNSSPAVKGRYLFTRQKKTGPWNLTNPPGLFPAACFLRACNVSKRRPFP